MNKRVIRVIIIGGILVGMLLVVNRLSLSNSGSGAQPIVTEDQVVREDNQILEARNNPIPIYGGRDYQASEITIEETLPKEGNYTPYIISYNSDNLKIYAAMNVPDGNGPFPVILLNHGYYNTQTFQTGDGTDGMATILADNGYLTLASDYRGHGKSEGEGGGHQPEYAVDVLNLLASVKNVENADITRIGMWGHSMGGETSLRAVEVANTVKALVLWAPTLGSNRSGGSQSSLMDYLAYIQTPISLHQGLADTEVNPTTSVTLSEALKKEGKEFEYFEYPGQDHNFQNLGWEVIGKRTVDYFDKYVKGGE